MSRSRPLSLLASLLLVTALPLASVACGNSKPAESAADEDNSSGDSSSTDSNKSSDKPADAVADKPADTPSAPPADSAPPAPPPPPAISDTDCGKCIDKICAKPAATCGKNTDCQATIDSFHGCGSDKGAAACLSAAALPASGKPKTLAKAYTACVKKASVGKTCKAKCTQ